MSMPNYNPYMRTAYGVRSAFGKVRVGRRYVFSNSPRPGFYPMQTRNGMVYAKRRTY